MFSVIKQTDIGPEILLTASTFREAELFTEMLDTLKYSGRYTIEAVPVADKATMRKAVAKSEPKPRHYYVASSYAKFVDHFRINKLPRASDRYFICPSNPCRLLSLNLYGANITFIDEPRMTIPFLLTLAERNKRRMTNDEAETFYRSYLGRDLHMRSECVGRETD